MANTYLTKTNSGGGSETKGTFSAWIKISELGDDNVIFHELESSGNYFSIKLKSGDFLVEAQNNSSAFINIRTNRVLRDFSAWYHIVVAIDSTQSTAANRIKIYINGVQETSFSTATYPPVNQNCKINQNNEVQTIGGAGASEYFDGYLSHVYWVDGTAYAASTFGSTDSATGQWKINTSPSLTMGTNGFTILKDGKTITDQSANSNNFSLGGGTLTKSEDCPSNNFPTLNFLVPGAKTPIYGNLHIEALYGSWKNNSATFGLTKGKWYYEFKLNQLTNYAQIGIVSEFDMAMQNSYWGNAGKGYAYNSGNGQYYNNSSGNSYGNSYTASNYMACAMDLDNNKLYFAKDNTWQNSGNPASGSTGTGAISISQQAGYDLWFPALSVNHCGVDANFGNGYFGTSAAGTNQDANGNGKFKYTPPSGYFSINTKNIKEFG